MADNRNQGGSRPSGKKLAQAVSTDREGSAPSTKQARTARGLLAGRKGAGAGRGKAAAAGAGTGGRRRFLNYPRAGKGPIRRWMPSWRFVLGSFLLCVLAVIGLFVYAYATINVPEPNEFALKQATTVYYDDGTTPMGEFADINRTVVDASTLPDYVGNAVVASEDRTFYSNNGVDPRGIVRALWNNLRGGDTQGASTLTQQYVKNYYVDTTDSYSGKFQQAIMAIKIDREQDKSAILGNYLNTVYYGRGAYGVQAAAEAYFDKDASQLTVSESALLAGILPAPSAYDPAVDPDKAQERWERVMDFMVQEGYISQEDYDSASYPETITPVTEQRYAGTNGYLLQMVRAELVAKADMTEDEIDTGGFTIVTTINKADQETAVATAQGLPEGHSENLHVALVSIDASTGGVISLYGGDDYLTNQVNTATDAIAQAGSTFKPFALVAAMENGATLANGYTGDSPMTIGGNEFQNFRNISYGWSDLIQATANSINTPYLQLNQDVGPELTNEVAVRAGYPEDTQGMNVYLQNVLGSASPHTIDIAAAFSTFAAQGVRHDAHIVGKVTNPEGAVAYETPTDGAQEFEDGIMADTNYALQQVVNNGSAEKVQALGRPIAAKTGSSSDNKSAQFVGYTPQVVTAVTLYQSGEDGTEETITPWGEYDEITGSTYPTDLFITYMESALQRWEVESFPDRTAGSYYRGAIHGQEGEVAEDYATSDPAPATQAPAEAQPQEEQQPTQEAQPQEEQQPTQEPQQPQEVTPNEPVPTGGAPDPGNNGGGNEGGGGNSGGGNEGGGGGGGNSGGGNEGGGNEGGGGGGDIGGGEGGG